MEKDIPGRERNKCKNTETQKSSGQIGNREPSWPKHSSREDDSSRKGSRKDVWV